MARRRQPRRRSGDLARRQRSSLVQLGMAILLLVMLIIFTQKLADGAAGCYVNLTEAPDGHAPDTATAPDAGAERPSMRVKVAETAADAGPAPEVGSAPAPPDVSL